MKKNLSFRMSLLIAIGYVIGSGIFFKADDVLLAAKGNTLAAVLSFIIVGMIVTFTAYSIAQISKKTEIHGGISAYMQNEYGKKAGYLTGFLMTFVFSPLLSGILSLVFVNYFFISFLGLELTRIQMYLMMFIVILFLFILNSISSKLAQVLSTTSTVVKIIPLLFIAIVGVIYGDVDNLANNYVQSGPQATFSIGLLLAPLISVAFAYDGWISVGALSVDMKDPQKDIPKVFVISLIIITILYTTYFYGVTSLLDNATIIASKDNHINLILTNLFSETLAKLMIFIVSFSVLGTLNANIMSSIRYPYALSLQDNFIKNEFYKKINAKYDMPLNAVFLSFVLACCSITLYYLQDVVISLGYENIFGVSLDNVTILIVSVCYILLCFSVFKKHSNISTKLISLIALVGQVLITISFIITTPGIIFFALTATIFIIIANRLYGK